MLVVPAMGYMMARKGDVARQINAVMRKDCLMSCSGSQDSGALGGNDRHTAGLVGPGVAAIAKEVENEVRTAEVRQIADDVPVVVALHSSPERGI